MTRVVFALERSAKTDPPGHPGGVMTDQGLAWYAHTPYHEGPWYSELCAYGSPPLDPQPSWWYDLRHAGSEGMNFDDLRTLLGVFDMAVASEALLLDGTYDAAARLRAALDALTR